MASNKMLIDASHPEETRVAVVRGNRIEEFDFESQAKKQLRGNIYLAKVTRVEPSLQAAFIDYGGNRHGFLAFSEIHPDYYQIPMADRQALLDEEALEAEDADEPEAKPVRKRRARKSSKQDENADVKSAEKESADDKPGTDEPTESSEETVAAETTDNVETVPVEQNKAIEEDAAVEEEPQPEASAEADADSAEAKDENPPIAEDDTESSKDDAADEADEEAEGDEKPGRTIAAIYETDTISEPAPEDDGDGDDVGDSGEKAEAKAPDEEVKAEAKEKPKRRTRRKAKPKTAVKPKKKTEKEEVSASEEEAKGEPAEAVSEEVPEVAADKADGEAAPEGETAENTEETETTQAKPKRRTSTRARKSTTRKRRSKPDKDEDGADASQDGENTDSADENGDDDIESVGREDALEEVPHRRKPRRQYKIQEVIKRRQVMLVQVVKEERGNKGAALTTYLSLAGRYSVLMPNTARGGGISRKITNVADRKRLKAIAAELDVQKGMGVILRTAGASRTKAEIKRDFEYLMRLWENVRELTLSSTAPCLVYEEGSLIKRSIRDLYDKNIEDVLVSGDSGYREAKEFMRMLMPSHAKNVKEYVEDLSIFSRFNVEQQLDRLVTPQVTLKSGGYLVINQTEALVSIDVNSGRSTREHSIE
ncbi:MAG: ribonuclease E/G, partial [Rhizobiaceae bacterium]